MPLLWECVAGYFLTPLVENMAPSWKRGRHSSESHPRMLYRHGAVCTWHGRTAFGQREIGGPAEHGTCAERRCSVRWA